MSTVPALALVVAREEIAELNRRLAEVETRTAMRVATAAAQEYLTRINQEREGIAGEARAAKDQARAEARSAAKRAKAEARQEVSAAQRAAAAVQREAERAMAQERRHIAKWLRTEARVVSSSWAGAFRYIAQQLEKRELPP